MTEEPSFYDSSEFMETISTLFLRYGARTLTMDEVARHFGVSKKTLYQHYPTKEALLLRVLDFHSQIILAEMTRIEEETPCPIDAILARDSYINWVLSPEKNAFLIQLVKYYPKVYGQHCQTGHNHFLEMMETNYQRGVAQGVYRMGVPALEYARLMSLMMYALDSSPVLEPMDYTQQQQMCYRITQFYLDALLSPEGRKVYEKLKTKYEKSGD